MTTLDQLAYNVLNIASGGRTTHNEHISLRQVKEWINQYRSLYIRRDEERNRRMREFEQVAEGLETELVRVGDPLSKELDIYRTVLPLPRLLRFKDNEALNYVGDTLGLKSYQVVSQHSIQFRKFSVWTPDDPVAYVSPDHRVHIAVPPEDAGSPSPEPGIVMMRGIFEDPQDFQEFLIDQDQADADAEWEYPLPKDMAETMVKNILETEMNIIQTAPLDTKQDNLPDHKMAQPST